MKKEKEEAFLFSTFTEFNKCWRSGTKARVIMESFNGAAFVNFSAYLGYPNDVHFHSRPEKRNPPKKPRKKSEKKVKRDNERASRFQSKKRKEEEEAAAKAKAEAATVSPSPSPSPGSAMTTSDREFSFASPIQENLRHTSQDKSLVLSDNDSPQDGAKKEQKCDEKKSVKVSICTDSDPFLDRTDMENVKEKELSETLKNVNDQYKELFLDLKRLSITVDRLAISFTDQTMNFKEVSMTTTTLIPGPKNVDLEHIVRQQKSEEIRRNLLARITNLKGESMRTFQVLKRTGFAKKSQTIVCETLASYEGYQTPSLAPDRCRLWL